jgi:hypothetical protein
MIAAGCASPSSQLQITDYQEAGNPRRFSVSFEEAFFQTDPRGNLDLILRHYADAGRGDPAVSQVVHVHTVWRSIPGQTTANDTQINGTVVYAILGAGASSTYEGAGAVIFGEDPVTGELVGRLSRVILLPKRDLVAGEPILRHVELDGSFRARSDRRMTAQVVNDLERMFGPRMPQPN